MADSTSAFDHRDAGTAAEQWDRLLAGIEAVDFPDGSALIVVAAHPDDETLGAGGLIATAAARGAAVTVIIASAGEASHPMSSTHSPAQLAAIRAEEVRAAVGCLAPAATLCLLGLPDGELADHVPAITQAMTEVLGDGPVWLVSPWSGDRHPDHEACAIAAQAVAAEHPQVRLWQYPIWMWHWADPDSGEVAVASMRRLTVPAGAEDARDLALRCYRSQTEPLSQRAGDEPVLSADFVQHFQRPYDVLIEHHRASGAQFFCELYSRSDDPWALATRWYERRKRQVLLASLPAERYQRAFEAGCATGLLTVELARRCDEVIAADVAESALTQTRERLGDAGNVQVRALQIPQDWPEGRFDLIVLSEVAYYCLDLAELADRIRTSLSEDATVVLCHWRHLAPDHPHTADHTHVRLRELTGLTRLVGHVEEDFLLDVLTVSDLSVARRDRIVTA